MPSKRKVRAAKIVRAKAKRVVGKAKKVASGIRKRVRKRMKL